MIRTFLTHHPLMKLFSFGLAIFLWFIIRGDRYRVMTVNIPLRYQHLPSNTVIAGEVPDMINLRLRGSKMRLANMDDEFFSPYIVNLEGTNLGENVRQIYPEDFKIPFGVSVDRISPDRIHFNLAKAVTKVVPVEANIVGSPATGFILKAVHVEPAEIQIRSHSDQLEAIQRLLTDEISLEGRHRSFQGNFKLNTRGLNINTFNELVKVVVELEETQLVGEVADLPVVWNKGLEELTGRLQARIEPQRVRIKISGPYTKVTKLMKTPPTIRTDPKLLQAALKSKKSTVLRFIPEATKDVKIEVEPKAARLVYGRQK